MITKISIAIGASLITGIIAFLINFRNNKLKYITEERQKWRAKIKKLVNIILTEENIVKRSNAIQEMILSLNPKKEDLDNHILEILFKALESDDKKIDAEKTIPFLKEIQQLLKYEWEKAKYEAHFSCSFNQIIISLIISLIYFYFYEKNYISPLFLNFLSLVILLAINLFIINIKYEAKTYIFISKNILDIPYRKKCD